MSISPLHSDPVPQDVANQPAAQGSVDLWARDPALICHAGAAGADIGHLAAYGDKLGQEHLRAAGREADRYPPELDRFDAAGRRLDEVRFHPAYHQLMAAGIAAGYASIAWEGRVGGHASHAAMVYLTAQVAPAICSPMTMTYAAIPALKADRALFDVWVPKLVSRVFDGASKPISRKPGVTMGLALTEKQGRGTITTHAMRDGQQYRLNGHNWFCSAPMSDGFLTLAEAPGGVTCFLLPRWLPEGHNGIRIERLKNKLGNRANATAEVEYQGALAYRLGEEGSGASTISETLQHMRLDMAMAPAGIMRAALDLASHWAQHRRISEKRLVDQPLMRRVMADLVLDWEGTLALGCHVARAFDSRAESDRAFARLAVVLAKYLGNKLCPTLVCEAMVIMGGAGYVEDSGLPALYREAPLNSIWDGSGNVLCLEVLHILRSDPLAGEALSEELGKAAGQFRRYDAAVKAHMQRFPKLPDAGDARWYVDSLATLLTASILIRQAQESVAGAYVATRLAGERGRTAGAIGDVDIDDILMRLGGDL